MLRPVRRHPRRASRGATLIEALIAVLVFTIGLLGIMKTHADGIVRSRDAMFRAEAAALAHELIGIMWTDRANLAAYQHRPSGSACAGTGAAGTSPNLLNWMNEFTTAATGRQLPGATSALQQVVVDTSVTPAIVRVHLCWQPPQATGPSQFVAVAQVPL